MSERVVHPLVQPEPIERTNPVVPDGDNDLRRVVIHNNVVPNREE